MVVSRPCQGRPNPCRRERVPAPGRRAATDFRGDGGLNRWSPGPGLPPSPVGPTPPLPAWLLTSLCRHPLHPCSIPEAASPNLPSSFLYSLPFWRPKVQGQGVPGPCSLPRLQRGPFLPLPASWGLPVLRLVDTLAARLLSPLFSVPSLCLRKGHLSLG